MLRLSSDAAVGTDLLHFVKGDLDASPVCDLRPKLLAPCCVAAELSTRAWQHYFIRAEHGCKWRGLPKRFGNWHTIYTRMNRWSKAGVLDRVLEQLQQAQVVRIRIEAVSLDSTSIKVHPDGTGALKKRPAVHRQVARRMEHQDSYGCGGCSYGRDVLALTRSGA